MTSLAVMRRRNKNSYKHEGLLSQTGIAGSLKKIYRKKQKNRKTPQLWEPVVMSPRGTGYSSRLLQPRSWVLLTVPRAEKSHRKQGALTSAMCSCQEVTTALNFSNLNISGERHAMESTENEPGSPKNSSFNPSLTNPSAPPALKTSPSTVLPLPLQNMCVHADH